MGIKEDTLRICSRNMKNLRVYSKMTQEAFAFKLNTSQSTISRLELGKDLPSAELLCRICDYYKLEVKDFYDDPVRILVTRNTPILDEDCYDMESKLDYLVNNMNLIVEAVTHFKR